jgi:hypothetical protein
MSPEAVGAIITASASMIAVGHGISSTQVTALATVVLVVITAIYVIFTGLLVREARGSSATAERAADAAKRAAEANTRSAVVAEISLEVDFRSELFRIDEGLVVALTFMGRLAVVYIFEVDIKVTLVLEGGEERNLEFPETVPVDPLPCSLTPGQETGFVIVFGPDAQRLFPESAFARGEIKYGFDQMNPTATYPFPYACLWRMPSPARAELRRASRALEAAEPEERPSPASRTLEAAEPEERPSPASRTLEAAEPEERPSPASRTLEAAEPTLVPEPAGEPGEPTTVPDPAREPVAGVRRVRRSRWLHWPQ